MAGENLDIHPDDLAMYAAQEAPPQSGSEVEEKPPATAEEVEEEEDIEEEAEETPYGLNMHCIQPNLWIGDWTASQQVDVLKELGIKHIIAAMRGSYKAHEGFQVHHVDVEDTDQTNMLAHFEQTNYIIKQALGKDEGILIHCQAGISRSSTICAAYLMESQRMTAEQAISTIAAVRSQVDPIDFFVLQLEMYERMNYVVDPATSQEYRRFLYNFNHAEIMDGDGTVDKLYLAYFPSPAIRPRARSRRSSSVSSIGSTLGMSSISRRSSFNNNNNNNSSSASKPAAAAKDDRKPTRRPTADFGMTPMSSDEQRDEIRKMLKQEDAQRSASPLTSAGRSQQTSAAAAAAPPPHPQETEKSGGSGSSKSRKPELPESQDEQRRKEARDMLEGHQKSFNMGQGRVQISGKRLRCKMCRRELAAREHVVEHQPGEGQEAFAPRRRDMTQFRADQNKTQPVSAAQAKPASSAGVTTTGSKNPRDNPNHPLNMLARRSAQLNQPSSSSSSSSTSPAEDGASEAAAAPHQRAASPPLLSSPLCTSYFVEPLSWMGPVLEKGGIGGKLTCPAPKCGSKLGSFDWAGQQCSCGAWVVPAFSLNASKVDEL